MTKLGRTMTSEEWLQLHREHLNRRGGEQFEEEPLAHAPEGYAARWLVCPCGAKHLTDVKLEE